MIADVYRCSAGYFNTERRASDLSSTRCLLQPVGRAKGQLRYTAQQNSSDRKPFRLIQSINVWIGLWSHSSSVYYHCFLTGAGNLVPGLNNLYGPDARAI